MNKLNKAKEIYDKIEIPEELNQIVIDSLNNYKKKMINSPRKNTKNHTHPIFRNTMVAAAVVVACFMIALNSSETFAKAAGNVPLFGGIAKVLTIRSYQYTEDNRNISVNVPEIKMEEQPSEQVPDNDSGFTDHKTDNSEKSEDVEELVADINIEIDSIVNNYLTDAKGRMQADKEAFIATGGTEEDWAKRDLNINVDYKVTYQQANLLSLVLSTDESWYGSYEMKYYYNIDLKQNKELTLKDILGEDYTEIANTSITKQMKERTAEDPDMVYWGITDGENSGITGFTSVDESSNFYLNENGMPVVCFEKYEIAPGFMGAQEFVIK